MALSGRPLNLKGRFPFRLGTTSYIIAADIVPNVEFLACKVDDIELVLFESDEIADLPDAETVNRLADLSAGNGLSYTVHLPLDVRLADADRAERRNSVDKCLRVVARMRALEPFAYVVHFHGDCLEKDSSRDVARWKADLEESVEQLLEGGVPPALLCVENLDYPFELVEQTVLDYGLSICFDVGHILLNGHPLPAYLERYFQNSRVVHLHGVLDGKDHRDISTIGAERLVMLFRRLCGDGADTRVVTLEVFNEADFEASLGVMGRLLT